MRKVHAFLVSGLCLLAGAACAQAPAAPRIDSGDTAWMLTSTLLVILMTIPGLALFYGGLGRAKNMLSVLVQVFVIFALCSLLWAIYGYSLAFSGEGKFVGDLSKMFLKGVGLESFGALTTIPEYVFFAFQGTFAAITVALIVGSFAERIKFSAVLIFAVLWFSSATCPWRISSGVVVCWRRTVRWTLPAAPWCTSTPALPAWWAPTWWASA